MFPDRVEILDWYHADGHISAVARALYGEGTEKAATRRTTHLDRLATDGFDQVLESLRFLGAHKRDRRQTHGRRGSGTVSDDQPRADAVPDVPCGGVRDRQRCGGECRQLRRTTTDERHALGAARRACHAGAPSIYRTTGAWDRFWATDWLHEQMSAAPLPGDQLDSASYSWYEAAACLVAQ